MAAAEGTARIAAAFATAVGQGRAALMPYMMGGFPDAATSAAVAEAYAEAGADPQVVTAPVGGGSNAIGMFTAFVGAPGIRLIGVEAGGRGTNLGEHCSSLTQGEPGILHGALSYLLQDEDGQVARTHSISAGLDYPGVGPEHAYLRDAGLAEYVSASDEDALAGFQALARSEGIIPALETAHAVAEAVRRAGTMKKDAIVVVNCSGRGDKDVMEVMRLMGQV